ncbi:MAG TPA: PDZ domain-containing protein, partial [Pyrinomonadaceae bacterium]|nr:PDZ domain-containing protein [Pyrinomonadaceae bacterium]
IVSPTRSITGKMEIDTGSTGVLLLNSPFVRKHRLVAAMTNSMGARTGGVGGSGTSKVGRFTGVKLGDTTLADPLVQLYTGTRGDNANPKYDGLLGGAVFRRFKMTVDMPGKRLFLEPNERLNNPFDTDMSGLEINASGDDLSVIDIDEVKPASVGAKAGIRGGERIRSVNGRPATELGLQEVKRILRTAGEVDLELERGRRVLTVHLVLKRVI